MAEDQDQASKTEEATPRKLEDARRKGDVAKSQDVGSWMSLAAGVGVLISFGGVMSQNLAQSLVVFLAAPGEMIGQLDSGAGALIAQRALMAAAPMIAGVMLAAAVAGAAGNVLQTGLLWSPDKLKFDFGKVSPMKGFQRIYGIDGFAQFIKTLIKLVITGWVAWRAMAPHQAEMQNLAALDPGAILNFSRQLLIALFSSALTFLGVTAAVDWIWQRQRFLARMKMSREELKEDFRQTEGDPHVKARLKQLRYARSRRRMMANVPKATVIVTNPTHYAVALRYIAGETGAPECVAKGVDTLALKIREIGGKHDIPIIEDPPLARALYAAVDVDETIPREHYEAVAKLIGFVMNKKARRAGTGPLGARAGGLGAGGPSALGNGFANRLGQRPSTGPDSGPSRSRPL
jgi:flagellar biosynthetic protein FlhB